MAARFLKAGYEVDLRTITDIEVQIGDRKLYVECKRIKSVKQLGKRISKANNQIRTRINKEISNKNRGMIALNLTDLLNPDSRPIITKSINDYSHNSFAKLNRQQRGECKPETFDFLGFTHICAERRSDSQFKLQRLSIKKKLKQKLHNIKEVLMKTRHKSPYQVGRWLKR